MEKVFDTMETLTKSIEKLRSKNLFPYNPTPLLKRLGEFMTFKQ
jgi:hypothetical protein